MGKCSFILQPSIIHGVGVFAVKGFAVGDHLPLFAEGGDCVLLESLPEPPFDEYCVETSDGRIMAPTDFTRMSVGWYMNNSETPSVTKNTSGTQRNRSTRAMRSLLITASCRRIPRSQHEHRNT